MKSIKANNHGDLIAAIPAMAGYTPVQSLVVVPSRDDVSVGLFRFDLPSVAASDETLDHATVTILSNVLRLPGIDGVICVVYSDEAHTAHDGLAKRLATFAPLLGLRTGVLFVSGDGWGAYGETPRPFTTLPVLDLPEAQAAYAHQGMVPALPTLSEDRATAIMNAVPATDATFMARVVTAAGEATAEDPANLSADLLALIGTLFAAPLYRDVILATWCYGTEFGAETLQDQIAYVNGVQKDMSTFLAGEGERPTPDALKAGLELAQYLAAVKPFTPYAYTVMAWLSWALGHSSAAHTYATRALEGEPITLASLIIQMCDSGYLPGWAFRA